jgi:TRAP-type C4-dicarboxylate transport system substrate-binding protein
MSMSEQTKRDVLGRNRRTDADGIARSAGTRRQFLRLAATVGLAGGGFPVLRVLGAAAPAKVRLATLAPKDSSFHNTLKVMAEKWRQAPGGGIDLTIYTDGTMGGEADMVRRMRIGQLQAAMITAMGLAEIDLAVAGLQKMPLLYRSLEEVVFVREKLRPTMEQRFNAKGFCLLCWADSGWVRFFSKTPASRPEDFKKLKMFTWSGDKEHIALMREEGYNPVPLEYTDTLTALQTGLIETVPTLPYYALAGQFFGSAPHMVDVKWAPLVGGIVITKKAWDALGAETRETAAKAALAAGEEIQNRGRKENEEAVEAMLKRGLTVHQVEGDLKAEWSKLGERIQPKVRGRLVPADLFDEVQKLLGEYRSAKSQ